MKIEMSNETVETFEDVGIGEVFSENNIVYLCIEANSPYANKKGQDGLAVNLLTGYIVPFHYYDEVTILRSAKLIC